MITTYYYIDGIYYKELSDQSLEEITYDDYAKLFID
jgi:hypothetical protein